MSQSPEEMIKENRVIEWMPHLYRRLFSDTPK